MLIAPASAPKCWRMDTKPHKFCPGCGHGIILKVLGYAVDELNLQEKAVYACDIGCSLLAWDFFNLDTIQAHHGRTTPVAVGMKRANPDLILIAYMGDGGGYAIGAQHIVAAAQRNDRITVILVNNTQYGMTGGQMAPTTLPGQKTETSPYGRDPAETGYPIEGPELVAAISGENAYCARGTVAKPRQLKIFIKRALENQISGRGFSFVEVLSTCPTNWRTGPEETWRFIEEDIGGYFRVGEIKVPAGIGKENLAAVPGGAAEGEE